jgi:hypoxanthine phosphoribosyltransferase
MEWSIKCLFEKIKDNSYDVIISDDIGGRLPSIIIKKLFWSQWKHLPILFIMGWAYIEETGKIYNHLLDTWVISSDSSVLLVTQMVDTGATLKKFSDVMEKIWVRKVHFWTIDSVSRDDMIHDTLELQRTWYRYYTGDWVDNLDDCHHRLWLGVTSPVSKQLHPNISSKRNNRLILQWDISLLCHRIIENIVENKNPQMRSYAEIGI